MLKFRDGLLLGCCAEDPTGGPPAGGNGAAATGQGGAGSPPTNGAAWSFPTDKAFAEYLPDTYKANPVFKDIKSFDSLLGTYVNAQKMIGADKATILQMPKADDEKGWGEFWGKLGRPDAADKYKVPARADGKPYSEADAQFHKQVLPVLHKAGLSQSQIDGIVPQWNAIIDGVAGEVAQRDKAEMDKNAAALKTELGTAYEAKLGLAQDALAHFTKELQLGDALKTELEASKLGNSPALFKLLAHLGGQLKEDGLIGRDTGGYGGALSPAEAQQQIAALEADTEFMKIYRGGKGNVPADKHKDAVARMEALYKQAHPPA